MQSILTLGGLGHAPLGILKNCTLRGKSTSEEIISDLSPFDVPVDTGT